MKKNISHFYNKNFFEIVFGVNLVIVLLELALLYTGEVKDITIKIIPISILIINLAFLLFSLPMFISYCLGKKLAKTYNTISIEDFSKNKDYFRDLLKNYDLAELSYLDNYNIDIPKDIVVILLNMEYKGIISLEKNDSIKIINKGKASKSVEKSLLNMIKNGKLDIVENDVHRYNEDVRIDSQNDGLIQKEKQEDTKKFILLFLLILLFGFYIAFRVSTKLYLDWKYLLIIDLTTLIFIISGIVFLFSTFDKKVSRTEKGKEINDKLEGLKNFLRDFSLLDEKNKEEIIIWEEYLIYSVLFNQNKKIIDEIMNKYFIKKI